jgi:hypothetical protein
MFTDNPFSRVVLKYIQVDQIILLKAFLEIHYYSMFVHSVSPKGLCGLHNHKAYEKPKNCMYMRVCVCVCVCVRTRA